MKISIIYRCCEIDSKESFRPKWFSKLNCAKNFLKFFLNKNIDILCVHDGEIGEIYKLFKENEIYIYKINNNSNLKSLEYCLNLAKDIVNNDFIYFLEDDYLHRYEAYDAMVDGFNIIKNNNSIKFLSLQDHMDRYTRTDDLDYGRTNVYVTNTCHWRTAESTTCTWAIAQEDYMEFGYNLAMKHRLNDRALFREALTMGKRLITPMPGFSTHCHLPFLSPTINWAMYT